MLQKRKIVVYEVLKLIYYKKINIFKQFDRLIKLKQINFAPFKFAKHTNKT